MGFSKGNETCSHGERTSQRSVAVHCERARQKPVALSAAWRRSPGDLEQTLGFSDGTFCLCGDTEQRQTAEGSSSGPSAKKKNSLY